MCSAELVSANLYEHIMMFCFLDSINHVCSRIPRSNIYITRMAHEVPRLVLQAISTVYAPLKDMSSYMNGKAKFVKKLEDNLSKMIVELGSFYSRKENIDRMLDTAVSKEKSEEYHLLIKLIEVLQKKYDKFVNKYQGLCQNLPSFQSHDVSSQTNAIDAVQKRKPTVLTRKFFKLATLSKKIKELLDDISIVNGKMNLENLSRVRKPEPVHVKHRHINLPSFTEYVDKILRLLSEDGNRSIGILGPIGVGKTTIMTELNNQFKQSPSFGTRMKTKFDFVIWIDFRKKQGVEDDEAVEVIQDVIIGRLNLKEEKAERIDQNAEIISRFLMEKKYILLIDQVSSTIDFDKVGIHRDHKFGKIVIASSSRKLITPMADQLVEIQPLSDNDALNLFEKVCGAINDDRIKLIAESIVRSCGGLPLVIKLVATHLKGQKGEEVWSDVKRLLQSETKARLRKLEGVGHAYKLVYDKLEKSEKKCLLFVTLFPSDHKISKDYLVECWNAERFLELDVPHLRTARECAATTMRELTDQYLLENHSDKHVKMPEYFRKVAVEQEYPGETDSLSWVPQKIQTITEGMWETTKRISLISYKSKLPNNPRSDKISTLLMQCNRDLVLQESFFENMEKLLILDLHRTMIDKLPTSISSLVSLRCLYLNHCPLLDKLQPEVGNLEKLELLDIRGTKIFSVPSEIGDMSQLRCLRISFGQKGCNRNKTCGEMMAIPLNMICRLHQLEELTIEAGCCSQAWNDIAEKIVGELASLEKLSTLNFHFPSVSTLKKFVSQSKSLRNTDTHWSTNTLRSFDISMGCCEMRVSHASQVSQILPKRRLRFSTDKENEEISSVKEVLRQTSSFELVGHCGVGSLSDFNLKNAGTLKVCVVECCKNMTSLVDGCKIKEMGSTEEETDSSILQCLEKLHLYDLQTLQSIWKGPVSSGSLANLKDLTLFGCPELTTVLNHELARTLSSLEYVKVENCSKVKEIINERIPNEHIVSEVVDQYDMLTKVKTIDLINLPMLQSICKNDSLKWRSLVKIAIRSCNILRDIHVSLSHAEYLETVECENSWWLQLPEEQNIRFLPCCDFIVVQQKSAIGVSSEGESSERGRSANILASKVNVFSKYKGKEMLRNGNTSPGYQEIAESSRGGEHVTDQPINNKPQEICLEMDSSQIEIVD